MRKKSQWLMLLMAAMVLLVLSGCSQPKQTGTRSMPGVAELVNSMTAEEVNTSDSQLDSGTAAAATYLLKSRSAPSVGEDDGTLADELRSVSDTARYSERSAPICSGVTRMSRLFIYPGDWSDDKVASETAAVIDQMAREVPTTSRQVVIDSYFTYTYTYSVNVRQAYSDQGSAWVVGVGINQTTKEEHKT